MAMEDSAIAAKPLFLGYGVTVGTTIYGLMDSNATAQETCSGAVHDWGNEYIQHFPFVALFCLFAQEDCRRQLFELGLVEEGGEQTEECDEGEVLDVFVAPVVNRANIR
jgi:hypothetical protein